MTDRSAIKANLARLAAGGLVALGAFALVPRWLDTRSAKTSLQGALHGTISEGRLVYTGATVGDAMDDLGTATGTRLVALPALRARPFSGSVPMNAKDEAGARELARLSGLELVQAGPHWALIEPRGRSAP